MRYFLAVLVSLLIYSCAENPEPEAQIETNNEQLLSEGTWTVLCHINDSTDIPFRLEIHQNLKFSIVNHKECIQIEDVTITEDSIALRMPIFDSEFVGVLDSQNSFSGVWKNYLKEDYSIPFSAQFITEEYLAESVSEEGMKYDVTFSPEDEEEKYKAIGLFHQGSSYSYGTFITETGDYRFLEGQVDDKSLELSCFDGSHLFYFSADIVSDSLINGKFYSGKHWYEPWNAHLREDAVLRDPDSLTYLLEGFETVEFSALDLDSNDVKFGVDEYKDHVSIIQIFGSWCPNCLDENVLYKELFEKYSNEGLKIIPVAFEPGDEFENHARLAGKHFEDLDMPYETYIGGRANKSITSEKFFMLNKIMSYPTSIFIDKKGKVRKIHTGFYGPGTGEYYTEYVMELKSFLEELINE